MTVQRDVLLADDASRNFFKNAKAFKNGEKPKEFNVRELMPEASDTDIAEVSRSTSTRLVQSSVPSARTRSPRQRMRCLHV